MQTFIRKPLPFNSRTIRGVTTVDAKGKRGVRFWSTEGLLDIGGPIPTRADLDRFGKWLDKARAWQRQPRNP